MRFAIPAKKRWYNAWEGYTTNNRDIADVFGFIVKHSSCIDDIL